MREKILIVDDEDTILEFLRINLEKNGFTVVAAGDGHEALRLARQEQPRCILLDVMLPGLDGFEVLRELRKTMDVPVIMLTAKGDDIDKILGLELGADDYVTKPFNPRELVARIKAILRRVDKAAANTEEGIITVGDLILDLERHRVEVRGKAVDLTPKEFELLELLMSNPGKVFSRDALLSQVWGYDYFGDTKTVDVHIRRLREKIEVDPSSPVNILTVWGVGYKFREEDDV
ncbi:MAG: response regulator transcription factor [bacterium]|nr:response regulator transcription factor [Bacillota bacterium]HHW55733.1 response regulator transcription factor [Bacillota bacterium]